jgi:catechol 2,3-dioxygenase-like lactoylglutathione lyase family enzyme
MNNPITNGVHHVGLTVSKLEESAAFYVSVLGWQEVRRNDEYPAIFVSDGSIMLTLWQTKATPVHAFDKNQNVGLHHIAFMVDSEELLHRIHDALVKHSIPIEFSPELLAQGPAKHMMCFEPSGIRVEFIWPGNS